MHVQVIMLICSCTAVSVYHAIFILKIINSNKNHVIYKYYMYVGSSHSLLILQRLVVNEPLKHGVGLLGTELGHLWVERNIPLIILLAAHYTNCTNLPHKIHSKISTMHTLFLQNDTDQLKGF